MAIDSSLAARAAWLSFIGNYTQSEIAKRLGVSSAKVHRLISQAQKSGLVRVFIDEVPGECVALEDYIQHNFNLKSCSIAPTLDDAPTAGHAMSFDAVGVAAAQRLHALLSNNPPNLIGVGKGRSLAAMVNHLPQMQLPDMKFVAVSGSLTRNLSANPYDIVHTLVERTGAEGYFLPVPYIARSVEERNLLQAQPSVQEMLTLGRRAELFVIGIGAIGADANVNAHIRQVSMVSETEWVDLRQKGAVCDIMGNFVDAQGNLVDSFVNQLSLGLSPKDIDTRPVMAVVGGHGKAAAVIAALRTGVITDLVTNEEIASQMKQLLLKEAA